VLTEVSAAGTDTVLSSVTLTLASNVENLTLTGTSAINGTGNSLANVLRGNTANNTLNGGTGADTMQGGAGNDTYVLDNSADAVVELAAEGIDLVQASVTHTLAVNVENLTLTGTSAINGAGNAEDNSLTGNSGNNRLTGAAGNDTLDGGSGADTMLGGTGNDIYVVNVTADVVTENAGEGTDTVRSSVTWTLGSNLENLTLLSTGVINGTGNALANSLVGNSAANVLTGAAGNDVLDGGAGNDTLAGGTGADAYLFGRGWGVDTVQENDTTAGVTDEVLFGAGIALADTTFTRSGNNLQVAIAGASDRLVVQNWYLGSQYQVEQFRYADGSVRTGAQVAAQVTALVSAMAAFEAPAEAEPAAVMRNTQWRLTDLAVAV
jgi:Ca2+-binding RTX toxin-like protein